MYAECCTPRAGPSGVRRRYYTKEERREWLAQYADNLEKELAAVRERIEALAA